jgi:hypothetical protein
MASSSFKKIYVNNNSISGGGGGGMDMKLNPKMAGGAENGPGSKNL